LKSGQNHVGLPPDREIWDLVRIQLLLAAMPFQLPAGNSPERNAASLQCMFALPRDAEAGWRL